MKCRILPSGTDMLDNIIQEFPKGKKDLSDIMVIFPEMRPSYYLLKKLTEITEGSYIPPICGSMDYFIYHFYENYLEINDRILDLADGIALLYEIHCHHPRPIGAGNFNSLEQFIPLAIRLYNDFEELYLSAISPDKIREIQILIQDKIDAKTQMISRYIPYADYYKLFYKKILESGYSTRSTRYRYIADEIAKPVLKIHINKFKKIIFAGFYQLSDSEEKIIRELMKQDIFMMFYHEGPKLTEQLSKLDIRPELIDSSNSDLKSIEPAISFYRCPDTHGEVLTVNRILENRIKINQLDDKTVIVMPTVETIFPLLQNTLCSLPENEYNISLGYPIQRTPLFTFLNYLMDLISGMNEQEEVYTPNLLRFILHPYTKNIYYRNNDGTARADITRIIFHTMEEILLQERTKLFWHIDELIAENRFQGKLIQRLGESGELLLRENIIQHIQDIFKNTFYLYQTFNNIGDLSDKSQQIIHYIYRNSTARKHRYFHPYCASILNHLEQLSNSLIREQKFEHISAYFQFFNNYMKICLVPFSGTPLKGLQLLGFWETRNIRFKEIIFLDINEDIFPSSRKEDTYLSYPARNYLGLKTYRDKELEMEYYFNNLIYGAGKVHLLFIENNRMEKSRFVEKLLWEKQKENKIINSDDFVLTMQYRIKLAGSQPSEIKKTPQMIDYLKNLTYSATLLECYLQCPLRFYYNYILGLQEKKIISEVGDSAETGKIVHAILKEYYAGLIHRPPRLLRESDISNDKMEKIIENYFCEKFGKILSGSVLLWKNQVQEHLLDFINQYQKKYLNQTTILALEKTIQLTYSDPAGDKFNLEARLDRIENRYQTTWIIDYKTGSGYEKYKADIIFLDNRDSWNKCCNTIQLPFYEFILQQYKQSLYASSDELVNFIQEDINSMILILGKINLNNNIEIPLYENNEIKENKSRQKWYDLIMAILKEIINPDIPFLPTSDFAKDCKNCSYQYLCDTRHLVKIN